MFFVTSKCHVNFHNFSMINSFCFTDANIDSIFYVVRQTYILKHTYRSTSLCDHRCCILGRDVGTREIKTSDRF